MPRINGDLIPQTSGAMHLGVDAEGTAVQGQQIFDENTITPFGHIHQVSGVFHDPTVGMSGIIRYSREQACFEVSVDGGLTFNCITTSATVVTSVGVIGDADLTGDIDLATPSSGFISIFDTANASPINFAVDQLGLSGLWDFPAQGFNGRVVNSLTDFHGTEVQGVVNVVGISGIIVDIVGQTMTIGAAAEQIRCYTETFGSSTTWTVVHNLGTVDVSVMVYDGDDFMFVPDKLEVIDTNTVSVRHNVTQAGRVVIFACL